MAFEGINIGCGPYYTDGWWNIDSVPHPGARPPDEIIDINELPYVRSFEKAYVGHVLEHIPPEQVVDTLNRITLTVREGGLVMVVGPCMDKAVAQKVPDSLLDMIRKHPEPTVDPAHHKWTPTEDQTLAYMLASDLKQVHVVEVATVVPPAWPNPNTSAWQCAIVGVV